MKKQLLKLGLLFVVFIVVAGFSFLKMKADARYPDLLVKADHHRQMGHLKAAEATAKEAVELSDDLADGHTMLGQIYLTQKKAGPAREQFETAIKLDADEAGNYVNLSFVYFNLLHDKHKALTLVSKAVKMEPANYQYHVTYGVYLERLGRRVEAIKQFELALKLEPSLKGLKAKVAALKQQDKLQL